MIDLRRKSELPGLLVSVRDADEALLALAAGVDVIDVKEPSRGSLGAADPTTIAEIVRAVDGRAPVTAALGELMDISPANGLATTRLIPDGVVLFKTGLAGCGHNRNWQKRWRDLITEVRKGAPDSPPPPVAVVYADWQAADAPNPEDVLRAAVDLHCAGLLIDTWNKSAGDLFDHWPADELQAFLEHVRAQLSFAVLAGSLSGESFQQAVRLSPDLVAVRGAACEAGRDGQISASRIHMLKQAITANPSPLPLRPPAVSSY